MICFILPCRVTFTLNRVPRTESSLEDSFKSPLNCSNNKLSRLNSLINEISLKFEIPIGAFDFEL